ncbi:MAG: ZIP family metal transporter [Lachnospiraceae bacterium]|nr:ZIP family metal transporter [Lachnospiraceae bacterium]
MELVLMTALGVGGATIVGAVIGFFVNDVDHKTNDIILGFAAGIMLAAAINGLIVPAVDSVELSMLWLPIAGIFAGALFLNAMDRLTPHLHKVSGADIEAHANNKNLNRAILFVMAVALHNLPEGMAAGVSFGNDDVSAAITVAVGIALQNIPEGIVTVSPLVMSGVKRTRALLLASVTGLIEVLGTFIGFYVSEVSTHILPFALAFAGGTMLYIISDEMIPETHSHGYERTATYSILIGFTLMLVLDVVL